MKKSAKIFSLMSMGVIVSALSISQLANAAEPTGDEPTLQRELPSTFYQLQPANDDALKNAVIEQLKLESGIDVSKLNVEVEDGVVKVSGSAASEAQAKRIIQISRAPSAVKWVESTVKSDS